MFLTKNVKFVRVYTPFICRFLRKFIPNTKKLLSVIESISDWGDIGKSLLLRDNDGYEINIKVQKASCVLFAY